MEKPKLPQGGAEGRVLSGGVSKGESDRGGDVVPTAEWDRAG